jgi:hypothetical protein
MPTENYDFAEVFQAVFIPKQKPAPAPVAPEMVANIASYPPLGQVTQLRDGSTAILCILELHASRASEPWQVALWHSTDGIDWTETLLPPLPSDEIPVSLQAESNGLSRLYFGHPLIVQKSSQFTLKFRHGEDEAWRWIRDEMGLGDGMIIVNSCPGSWNPALEDAIPNLNSAWKITSLLSQSPGTTLWSLEANVGAAVGDESTFADIELGTPWGGFLR